MTPVRISLKDSFNQADLSALLPWEEKLADKVMLEAPTGGDGATCRSCAHCPWMAMNGLVAIHAALQESAGEHEILVDEAIRQKALVPLDRMLAFAAELQHKVQNNI